MMRDIPDTDLLRMYVTVLRDAGKSNPTVGKTVSYVKNEIELLELTYGKNVSSNTGRRTYRALEFMIYGALATFAASPVSQRLDRPIEDVEKSLYYNWQIEQKNKKKENE